MAHIHRKYIDSHWLTFIFKGLLALLFGWLALFNSGKDLFTLISFTSIFLLGLSIIEFGNSLHRAHMKTGWLVSVAIALIDTAVALTLLLTLNLNISIKLILLSSYTIIRGLCEVFIAFRTTVDPTDRFIWLLSGVCGTIMGIAILNSGHLATTDFVRFFGAYVLIIGVTNLIYGVHNHSQSIEDSEARSEALLKSRKHRDRIKAFKKSPAPKKPKATSKTGK